MGREPPQQTSMLVAEAGVERNKLVVRYELANPYDEKIYVFDQDVRWEGGPGSHKSSFDSSLAWVALQGDSSVLFFKGHIDPPRQGYVAVEAIVPWATEVAPGESRPNQLTAALPLEERSPYVTPSADVPPVAIFKVDLLRIAVEFVRRSRTFHRPEKHPWPECAGIWSASGHPTERASALLRLPEPILLHERLKPEERFS